MTCICSKIALSLNSFVASEQQISNPLLRAMMAKKLTVRRLAVLRGQVGYQHKQYI